MEKLLTKIKEDKLILLQLRSNGYCATRLRAFIQSEASDLPNPLWRQTYQKELNDFVEKQILKH